MVETGLEEPEQGVPVVEEPEMPVVCDQIVLGDLEGDDANVELQVEWEVQVDVVILPQVPNRSQTDTPNHL